MAKPRLSHGPLAIQEEERMSEATEIATSAYGNAYAGMLFTCLYSIQRSCPDTPTAVYWQDIDETRMTALSAIFPRTRFVKTAYNIAGTRSERISSKVLLWRDAVVNSPCKRVIVIDSDTLVLRDPAQFFTGEFDVAFTFKDERVPLNTGVMLFEKSASTNTFFSAWLRKTMQIVEDKGASEQASSPAYPYGGITQMALYQLIDYQRNQLLYQVDLDGCNVRLQGLSCSRLNETNSVPLSSEKYILHYKGGWHGILTRATGFTRNRPRSTSWDMHLYYLNMYVAATDFAMKRGIEDVDGLFPMAIPRYLSGQPLHASWFGYFMFASTRPVMNAANAISRRARRVAEARGLLPDWLRLRGV
jgi:hypothetical protein